MTDGLVIMAIGMGVVFAFLVILMIFIRLLGLRAAPAAAPAAPARAADAGESAPDAPAGAGDDGVARAAAIAVALELAGRRSRAVSGPLAQADPGAAWRSSGRAGLHAGPRVVAGVLASRRSNQ